MMNDYFFWRIGTMKRFRLLGAIAVFGCVFAATYAALGNNTVRNTLPKVVGTDTANNIIGSYEQFKVECYKEKAAWMGVVRLVCGIPEPDGKAIRPYRQV
jgi:hypothetical protein